MVIFHCYVSSPEGMEMKSYMEPSWKIHENPYFSLMESCSRNQFENHGLVTRWFGPVLTHTSNLQPWISKQQQKMVEDGSMGQNHLLGFLDNQQQNYAKACVSLCSLPMRIVKHWLAQKHIKHLRNHSNPMPPNLWVVSDVSENGGTPNGKLT